MVVLSIHVQQKSFLLFASNLSPSKDYFFLIAYNVILIDSCATYTMALFLTSQTVRQKMAAFTAVFSQL